MRQSFYHRASSTSSTLPALLIEMHKKLIVLCALGMQSIERAESSLKRRQKVNYFVGVTRVSRRSATKSKLLMCLPLVLSRSHFSIYRRPLFGKLKLAPGTASNFCNNNLQRVCAFGQVAIFLMTETFLALAQIAQMVTGGACVLPFDFDRILSRANRFWQSMLLPRPCMR